MDRKEIRLEMKMTYKQLVSHLKEKYGAAQYNYFVNEKCKSKNKKVTRTSEGLLCHHIDESDIECLSDSGHAALYSFEHQKAEHLVYCNYIEHLLLHLQIGVDLYWASEKKLIDPRNLFRFITPGVQSICADINDLYKNYGSPLVWKNRCFEEIKDNFEDYAFILLSFMKYFDKNYEGYRDWFYLSKKIKVKELGEGTVVNITGQGIYSNIFVEFPSGIKVLKRVGNYDDYIDTIRNQLCGLWDGSIFESLYELLWFSYSK